MKTQRVQFILTAAQMTALKKLAKNQHVPNVSALVRTAVDDFLSKYEEKKS